jgi:hypothetical protein
MIARLISMSMLVAVLAARGAAAETSRLKPEAQTHLDAALKAYEAKDYDAAIREFERAYQIDPNPNLLYATAQAYRFANRCGQALPLYRRYLELKQATCAHAPDREVCEAQVVAATTGISLCEAAMPLPPTVEPPAKPAPAPEPPRSPASEAPGATAPLAPPAATAVAEPRATPWYRDPLGGALTAGGVVGIGVGVAYFVMAGKSAQAAKTATLRDDFLRALDDTTQRRRVGATATAIGAALAIGGVVVYVRHDRRGTRRVVGATDGRSLYLAGWF